MNGCTRRLSATVASIALILALGAFAGTATAVTETRTVPAELVFINGARADDPGNCSALVFLRWADVPGTTSGTGHYVYRGSKTDVRVASPFDDTGEWVIPYAVAPGFHWVMLTKSWTDGPGVRDCSDLRAAQEAVYAAPASVDLTVDVPKAQSTACKTAKAAAVVTRGKVTAARKALAKATTKAGRARARAALNRATAKHTVAVKKVKKSC